MKKIKCEKCNNENLKYVRSQRGILCTTIIIYYCENCKREIRIVRK